MININTYLISKVLNSLEIRTVVPSWARSLFLIPVSDFGFKVRVCLFERTHFLQVGGQAIVQALHGCLFISREEPIAAQTTPIAEAAAEAASTIAPSQATSQARGDKPGRGHGHTSATRSPVDAGGPEAAAVAEGSGSPHHGRAGLPEAVTGHGEEKQGLKLSCTSAVPDPGPGECPAPPQPRFYAGDNGSCLQNVLSETHGIYQPKPCANTAVPLLVSALQWADSFAVPPHSIPSPGGIES